MTDAPVTHGVCGLSEAAALIGVSPQRVRVLRQQYAGHEVAPFPVPQQPGQGPVWFEHHIRAWIDQRKATGNV